MIDSNVVGTNIADKIARLRAWENANLPIAGTILGYDVVVLLAKSIESGGKVPSSTLYGELNYSEAALRLHIQRLQREGFVLRSRDGEDGRNRSIVLTDTFRDVWAHYTEMFQDLFEIPTSAVERFLRCTFCQRKPPLSRGPSLGGTARGKTLTEQK